MSSSQILQSIFSIPARSRQVVGNWRNRVASPGMLYFHHSILGQNPILTYALIDKAAREGRFLQRSFRVHRPVWVTAGGAMYTTAGAVYLTLRYLRRLR